MGNRWGEEEEEEGSTSRGGMGVFRINQRRIGGKAERAKAGIIGRQTGVGGREANYRRGGRGVKAGDGAGGHLKCKLMDVAGASRTEEIIPRGGWKKH